MNKYLLKKSPLIIGVGVFAIFCTLFIGLQNFPGHKELYRLLIRDLTKVEPLPVTSSISSPSQADNIVYILGGTQNELVEKIKTAAGLYRRGLCKRIWSLSRPGITEFDHQLHRNLTNDEWFVKTLTRYGVSKEDIELVKLKQHLFGTLTEAKGISDTASQRGYKHIILVTSPYHTMRTWLAFSKYVKVRGIALNIYASNYQASLTELVLEYIKLLLYSNDLLAGNFSSG
jgi:uncharacterized SAM-binding protein YcdF (DUF218 family)